MHIDYSIIGRRIKEKRRAKHMTQEQLAEHLDVTIGYVSQLERGATKINLEILARIANLFDCDIAEFVTNSNTFSLMDESTDELITAYHQLSSDEKNKLLALVKFYIEIK